MSTTKIRYNLTPGGYTVFAPSAVEGLVGQTVEVHGYHGIAGNGVVVEAAFVDEQGIAIVVEAPGHVRMFADAAYPNASLAYEPMEGDGERYTRVKAESLSPSHGPVNAPVGGGKILTDAEVPRRHDGQAVARPQAAVTAGSLTAVVPDQPAQPVEVPSGFDETPIVPGAPEPGHYGEGGTLPPASTTPVGAGEVVVPGPVETKGAAPTPEASPAAAEPVPVPAGVEAVGGDAAPAAGVTEVAPQPDSGSTDGGSSNSE